MENSTGAAVIAGIAFVPTRSFQYKTYTPLNPRVEFGANFHEVILAPLQTTIQAYRPMT